jgi:hypothetical protein
VEQRPDELDGLLHAAVTQAAHRGKRAERFLDQRPDLLRLRQRVGARRPREGEDPVVGGVLEAQSGELQQHHPQGVDRVLAAPHAPHAGQHDLDARRRHGVDQPLLVPEVVVDGRRRVAAAVGEPPHREALEAVLHQQRLGGIEDRAARSLALLVATARRGRGSARGGCLHGSPGGARRSHRTLQDGLTML